MREHVRSLLENRDRARNPVGVWLTSVPVEAGEERHNKQHRRNEDGSGFAITPLQGETESKRESVQQQKRGRTRM